MDALSREMIVDFDELVELTAGDSEILLEVLRAFESDYPRLVRDLREAMDSADAVAVGNAGHALKGVFFNLAARSTGDLAFELERLGKKGTLEGAEALFSRLREKGDEVARQLVLLREELDRAK